MSDEGLRSIEPVKDHIAGERTAKVAIVEYGDYGCSDCRRLQEVLREVRDSSGQPLKYVFRHLLLVSSGKHRLTRAIASEAAARQGLFWEMHDALFRHAHSGDVETQVQMAAEEAGLDMQRFALDRDDPLIEDEVSQDMEQAVAHGIDRVPTLFIRGSEYNGAWDVESIQAVVNPPLAARVRSLSEQFASWAASGGVVLIVFSTIALIWRNSVWSEAYEGMWHLAAGFSVGTKSLSMSLHHWVNDLLMAIFFLVVGLELKREILTGELASRKRAVLPVAAAIGGMVVPAAIYLAFNAGTDRVAGWGVPMATDIAFTLGMLALLGPRVPASLKVFAAALAIADDLGAILVLAIAYNHGLSFTALFAAGLIFALLVGLNRARVLILWPYLWLGAFLWLTVYFSGLHATLAGVLLAATIPTRREVRLLPMLAQGAVGIRQSMRRLEVGEGAEQTERERAAQRARTVIDRLEPPAVHLEHTLQPWSTFLVLPVFALANAGIAISLGSLSLTNGISLGILFGLVLGKPFGILAGTWFVDFIGLGQKPADASWRQIFGVGCLCGIGFTMSIFIATEAFQSTKQLEMAKLAVMIASVVAAVSGFVYLRFLATPTVTSAAEENAGSELIANRPA